MEMVVLALAAVSVLLLVTLVVLVLRVPGRLAPNNTELLSGRLEALASGGERIERTLREELAKGRDEATRGGRELRTEVVAVVQGAGARMQETAASGREELRGAMRELGETLARGVSELRGSLETRIVALQDTLVQSLSAMGQAQRDELARARADMEAVRAATGREVSALREAVDLRLSGLQTESSEALARMRNETQASAAAGREESRLALRDMAETLTRSIGELRGGLEAQMGKLQQENGERLELMRQTVDEKLQGTLDKRLGESFRLVSDRLEQVQRGLGEMQALATGVGDLRKVLTNVKARGTFGEVQLGALLEQVLTQEQFARNVATTGTRERVEFAIRLPGKDEGDGVVWLPIDAKFPLEDYQRLVDAAERADADAVEVAACALERRIRDCAKDISHKYVAPPATTDFAILFLPTEGLYAEVLRRPGLAEALQREHRVVIAGPTTLMALLSSLRMGFQTLAVQQRTSEVWKVLGQVKLEFGKYATVLDQVKRKLKEATSRVDDAAVRTRAVERTLRNVETLALPGGEAGVLELLPAATDATDVEEIA